MTQAETHLRGVHEFYCANRPDDVTGASIYRIWEKGEAFKDSVTPSSYVPQYRWHMVLKILSLTRREARIFSMGCGNGFVEADLQRNDRTVRAMDCNEEAVELTRGKGVDAFTTDYFSLTPEDVAGAAVIYADGLLGHLFDADAELDPAFEKLRSLNLAAGTCLVFSNDAPRDPTDRFAPHERVQDFWLVSRDYLHERLAAHGLAPSEGYYFPYLRPLSGLRNRTICVARVP